MRLFEFSQNETTEMKENNQRGPQILERSTKNLKTSVVNIPEKKRVRFVHIADVHLGAFKSQHEALRDAPAKILRIVVEFCKKYNVDFILIAGDLFHGNVVKIEIQKECAAILTEADENGIKVYGVYGSHDASPTHSSSVDVLAAAKRIIPVEKMIWGQNEKINLQPVFDKSGISLVGIHGRKREIEVEYLEKVDFEALEKIPKPRIFVLHSAVAEYRPDFLKEEGLPLSLLPKNFDYYACGHVHRRIDQFVGDYGRLVYPGALFGSSLRDLEENTERLPGFYLVDFDETLSKPNLTFIDIYSLQELTGYSNEIPDIMFVHFSFGTTTPGGVEKELKKWLEKRDLSNMLVYIKLEGKLTEGKRSHIPFEEIVKLAREQGAIDVLVNREGLLEPVHYVEHVVHAESIDEIEIKVAESFFQDHEKAKLALRLLNILGAEKMEGESTDNYRARIKAEVDKELG